jgi:hypothetical protein
VTIVSKIFNSTSSLDHVAWGKKINSKMTNFQHKKVTGLQHHIVFTYFENIIYTEVLNVKFWEEFPSVFGIHEYP